MVQIMVGIIFVQRGEKHHEDTQTLAKWKCFPGNFLPTTYKVQTITDLDNDS